MGGYQDYFTSGAPPIKRPNVASGALPKSTVPTGVNPFNPAESAWFKQDAYSSGAGFGDDLRNNPRKVSGFGSFTDYEPKQKGTGSGFGDFGAINTAASAYSGFGDPQSLIGGLKGLGNDGFGQEARLASATSGGFGNAFPSYNNMARSTTGAKSPAGYTVNKWWDPQEQAATGGSYMGTGQAVFKPGFGQFTPDAIPEINAAAAKYGVPAAFLYAIIGKESSGKWNGGGPQWVASHSPSLGNIIGYVGVFEKTAASRGLQAQYNAAASGSRAAAIELLAGVLRSQYDQIRKQNGAYDWINVAAYHYSGDPSGRTNPAGWERNGTTVDYMNRTREWVNMLGGMGNVTGGGAPTTGGPSGTAAGMNAIWGGQNFGLSQGFGRTDFSSGAGAWMYGYGAGLGVPGGHPGLDVSMSAGQKLYVPVNGTVIRAGGSGSFEWSGGTGPGKGELRIQADDGTLIILGHMMSIPWKPGQRVSVGQLAGLSGGFNGDHLHLEVRVPGNTSTGWKAIDPRTYFGNQSIQYGTPSASGGYNTGQAASSNRPWWEQI